MNNLLGNYKFSILRREEFVMIEIIKIEDKEL
jgi:hypothetical protein